MAAMAFAPAAIADSQSTVVYDQSPWENEQVLKLFSDAWDQGRNYPTQAELEAIGLTIDLEFVRSHTRFRPIVKDAAKDVVSDINHDRLLWCNFPAGYGKNIGGYPSTEFDQDVFSMWNYTNLFGSWNYGFLLAPGSWVDAAHKNGTRIYGGIKFYESWNDDGSEATFYNFINTKNDDGTYKYARAFVNAAAFFGNDGYNYNSEGTIHNTATWNEFHKAVMDISRELNIEGFGIGQYTTNPALSSSNIKQIYGNKETGKIFDCMLNYSGNKLYYRGAGSSAKLAESDGPGLEGVYQGHWCVGLSTDYWTQMNTDDTKKMNICLWGEHDQSRFFQFRIGDNVMNTQANYQLLLEKAFSGANRNPLSRPAINNAWGSFQVATADLASTQLNNSPGFASMFPERTAINSELPFETHFSLGNGENYFYKGKVTHGSWYNMSQQDIVPTYRWLVTGKGDMTAYASDIDVRFTHEDAYMAGSSLRITGVNDNSNGNDLVLYRTKLTASEGNVKAKLALKGAVGASNLSLIVKKEGAANWIEVPFGNLESTSWEVKELPIAEIAKGDVIEYIGLRVNDVKKDNSMLVGQLKISDDREIQQALIKKNSVIVEIKEETAKSLSVKIGWEPDYAGYTTSLDKFGMVYNDEINVDHFEIVYKEGVDGKVKELGRTAQWATYIGNIPMTQTTEAYIGVRSVSVDLKCISPVEWVEIPHYAGELPAIEEEDPYGRTYLYNYGSSTLESILSTIYWEKVTTTGADQNIDYNKSSNPVLGTEKQNDNYYFATEHLLKVSQGQTVTINLKAKEANSDCLKYDFVYLYMDYDGNYSFMDADETLGSVGKLNSGTAEIANPGVSFNFTVPADAKTGPTRLRIVGSDAWGAHPGPTGGTWKGHSLDFPVEISGTNDERGPAKTYKDYRDQGEAEEPEYIENGFAGIDDVAAEATFSGVEIVDRVAYFTNTDKAWFYNVDGRCVKFVANAAETASVSDLAAGVYVVKMQNGQIIRSAKVVVK